MDDVVLKGSEVVDNELWWLGELKFGKVQSRHTKLAEQQFRLNLGLLQASGFRLDSAEI